MSGNSAATDALLLYGIHTVRAALENPHRHIHWVQCTRNAAQRLESAFEARRRLISGEGKTTRFDGPDIVETAALDALVAADAVHQGVVAHCDPLPGTDRADLFDLADARLLLLLDQITDPHNVGAIMRSAVAFAADAVITTHRNSAAETSALAKSASGALDMIATSSVRNMGKSIETLNEIGFVSIGLDSEGPQSLEATLAETNNAPIALVLGAEGRGLREKTRESCVALARLDMPGRIRSLNVSNAAALALYLASSRRQKPPSVTD
ncbi:MAG: RNA methyltransferase [Ahrensia sp.]|nr:RNA methyltransferase [Ahrensia sp.]